jgi:hypothetical protein
MIITAVRFLFNNMYTYDRYSYTRFPVASILMASTERVAEVARSVSVPSLIDKHEIT